MTRAELAELFPQWDIDPRIGESGWWGKPYESVAEATIRARGVVDWMLRELVPQAGIHVFIIHADFKRLLIAALLRERAATLMPILGPMHNVGITRFQWQSNQWQLNSLNATTHLPAEFVT